MGRTMSSNRKKREPRIGVKASDKQDFSVCLSKLKSMLERQCNAGFSKKPIATGTLENNLGLGVTRITESTKPPKIQLEGSAGSILDYLNTHDVKIKAGRTANPHKGEDDFSDLADLDDVEEDMEEEEDLEEEEEEETD